MSQHIPLSRESDCLFESPTSNAPRKLLVVPPVTPISCFPPPVSTPLFWSLTSPCIRDQSRSPKWTHSTFRDLLALVPYNIRLNEMFLTKLIPYLFSTHLSITVFLPFLFRLILHYRCWFSLYRNETGSTTTTTFATLRQSEVYLQLPFRPF